jgi:hypothetical protein
MIERRSLIKKLSALTALAFINPFTEKAEAKGIKLTGTLVHHVFFWLKEPKNPAVRKQFEKAMDDLRRVSTIKFSHTGVPAGTESRDVVDHSYTYSMITFFDSQEGQDAYQVDPIHDKFVKENSHLWNKVVVYDTLDI